MTKTLALCIPAYNAAKYLPLLLTSAKKQDIPFDEILVYNDCSTDNTEEIARKYGATVINGDINRGCSVGKNTLAELCKSDWIHFHDADDDLFPNFTSLAHKWMNKANCPDVVLFDYHYTNYNTKEIVSTRNFDSRQLEEDPIAYAIAEQINPFCGLYKRSRFIEAGGYDTDPKVLYNEDSAMHIKIAISGLTFSSESEVAIINFKMGNSMSQGNYKKCIIAQYEVLAKTKFKLDKLNMLRKYKRPLKVRLWNISKLLLSIGELHYAKKAIDLIPKDPISKTTYSAAKISNYLKFKYLQINEYRIRLFKPKLRKL